MKKGPSEAIDDIRAGSPPPQVDGFDILATLAVRHGLEISQLIDELSGKSGLARIARSLLGLDGLEQSKRKRGGQRKDDLNWVKFDYALRKRIAEPSISTKEIARRWVAENGGENAKGSRAESLEKQLNRLYGRWGGIPTLELLMVNGPPSATRT